MICGFCEEPGHHQDGCIKHGPPFWPDWHTKKVKQFNAEHGAHPKNSAKAISPPPPPKALFETNLRTLQMIGKQVTSELEQQLDDNTEGNMLMHRAIAVRPVHSDCTNQVIIQDQFDAQNESGSAYALGSDTSSTLPYNDLKL